MQHLLIVAHGSRRHASNQEIRYLAEKLNKNNRTFASISCAFLELATPSIPDGLLELIEQGAAEIIVMPYFLSAGRHVSEDIPAAISSVLAQKPNIKIQMADYLGASPRIGELLLEQALSFSLASQQ